MPPIFAQLTSDAISLHAVEPDALDDFCATQPDHLARAIRAQGFDASVGAACLICDGTGAPALAVAGMGTAAVRHRGRYTLAAAASKLPEGVYALKSLPDGADATVEALGWLFGQYRFDRYKSGQSATAQLVCPDNVDGARVEAIVAGEVLSRDLINTPASDMGPDELEAAARDIADAFGATISVIRGDDLLKQNFPMIHAVGRASTRAPRLIDMHWGKSGPTLTLVGKGVCFDTGGLNLKPASSMGLMKKDMGGAATVLGLARMIMALGLGLRLRVLIPAVENSVSGTAFRPQDILTARNGLTVEINNTDAEGRLVLADALALAVEGDAPDLLVSMATLTGAARVAVGPDLAPFYCDDDDAAATLAQAATRAADPVWRMPFWAPYEPLIEPGIADLDNAPSGGMAGSITAALFLRRFAGAARYMHFDIYGWQPQAAPGRPKGGAAQGARALLEALPGILKGGT